MSIQSLTEAIKAHKTRSAWKKGVKEYALDILDDVANVDVCDIDKKTLLNGADSWRHYSECGSALAYDSDIAERLCSPSELKRLKGGERVPSAYYSWIGVQARALHQACSLILRKKKEILK